MKWLWFSFSLSFVLGSSAKGFNYCCLDCNGRPHALCKEALPTDEVDCKVQYYSPKTEVKKYSSNLTQSDLIFRHRKKNNRTAATKKNQNNGFHYKTLMKLINQNRKSLANDSRVPNMEAIVWDTELKKIAVGVAQRCGSIQPLCLDTAFYQVTSMIYNRSGSTITPGEVMDHWNKGTVYGVTHIGSTEEYKPLALPTISRMGCSIANYEHTEINRTVQLTCLFGPFGRFTEDLVGHKGDPCSRCPLNTNCSTNGSLCVEEVPRKWSWDPTRTSRCRMLSLPEGNQWYQRYIVSDDENSKVVRVRVRRRHICDPIVINEGAKMFHQWIIIISLCLLTLTSTTTSTNGYMELMKLLKKTSKLYSF